MPAADLHPDSELIREIIIRRLEDLSPEDFDALAVALFRYQATHNGLYARYLSLIGRAPERVTSTTEIPFLPISLFKNYLVQTGDWTPEAVFTSSGTTGMVPSRHAVRSLDWYHRQACRTFEAAYGPLRQFAVLALLPAYLERQGSSLVDMAAHFITKAVPGYSGFYLHDTGRLVRTVEACRTEGIPVLLLGVSFALLDLAAQYQSDWSHCIVMETGGMKGRRPEMTRDALHARLKSAFNLRAVHSEYGMTELLSQAYSAGDGLFRPGPLLRTFAREATDPFTILPPGRTGALNIADLANLDTCCFVATDDLGRCYRDGSFEVLGRLDAAELRGCNLMLEG